MSRQKELSYGRQWIDADDISAVIDALRADVITRGEKAHEFEQAFAQYVGAEYAIAVSSGTAALHIACMASGMGKGDQVATSALTFAATANMIRATGAEPYFVDVDNHWNIIPEQARGCKYIVPVDFAGMPCDISREAGTPWLRNRVVIEDACHALGATVQGQRVGSIADMTCFSFHPLKAITTGEGGMVTTNDEIFAQRLRRLRDHGRCDGETVMLGFNYWMTDFQAALGMSQLKKLDMFLHKRRAIAQKYCWAFGLQFYPNHAYHLFVVLVDNRDDIKRKLDSVGIHCQIHYKPLHLHEFYKANPQWELPNVERYYERCLSLPIYPKMTRADVEWVIEEVKLATGGGIEQ